MSILLPALAIALTILVEGFVAALILGRGRWIEAAAIQAVTWPAATTLIASTGLFWPVELGVACTESILWLLVVPISVRKSILISFVANLITAAIGWSWLWLTVS